VRGRALKAMGLAENIIGEMRAFLRLAALSLALLMIAMISSLTAMRFAIHGREVSVPKLIGLTPAEAEKAVTSLGLQVAIERQYYSADIALGQIMTQVPEAGTRVRRGWKVRVAESLGPQRVSIPELVGQSGRAAEINIRRRGLEVGSIGQVELPDAAPGQVVSQSPPPNASGVAAPRISFLVAASADPVAYVMPSFLGQSVSAAERAVQEAGMRVVGVNTAAAPVTSSDESAGSNSGAPGSVVVGQSPAPGQKVRFGSTVSFTVRP
jgi:beta-lactam-binding protein with PASTA domain